MRYPCRRGRLAEPCLSALAGAKPLKQPVSPERSPAATYVAERFPRAPDRGACARGDARPPRRRLRDARVLDLFAGTGALGLEAISRGARQRRLRRDAAASLHALRANVVALRMRDRTRIFKRTRSLSRPRSARTATTRLRRSAVRVAHARPRDRHVARGGFSRVLAVEHARTHVLPAGAGRLLFDDTAVTVYRV